MNLIVNLTFTFTLSKQNITIINSEKDKVIYTIMIFNFNCIYFRTDNGDGTQLIQMDCLVNSREEIPGGEESPVGTEFESPFPSVDLFNAFVNGGIGDLLIQAAVDIGISFAPNLDFSLFTSVVTAVEVVLDLPKKTTEIIIGNLGLLTSPIGSSNSGPYVFGVDVSSIEEEITVLTTQFFSQLIEDGLFYVREPISLVWNRQ